VRTADALTAVRYICTPIVMWLIFSGHVAAALCVYALALVTDVLDGHFARRSGVISWYGATFDGLADILLVYGTIVALVVTGGAFWLLVGAIAGVAYLVPVLGLICSKKRGPSIPHLDTSLLAVSVHATIMAHVVGWPHAEFLLPFLMLVLVYYAHKYLAYARSI
jgi:phosphatidylglycerophosphate synthase